MTRLHAHRSPIALAAILLTATSQAWGNEPNVDRSVTALTSVSDQFRQEVERASRSIPDSVWRRVSQSGWQIRLAEFVVDASPALRNARPRGWPSSATWYNSDAAYLPTSKLLVVAEKRRTSSGRVVSSSRVPGVLRHEFGHAFDIAVGGPHGAGSATPEFVAEYLQDVELLSRFQRDQMNYYLQDQRAGRQEAFAEAFAIVLGGGSDTTKQERFTAAFPRVIRHVRLLLASPAEQPRQGG